MTDAQDKAGDDGDERVQDGRARVIVVGGNQTVTETLLLLLELGEVASGDAQLLIEAGDNLEMAVLAGSHHGFDHLLKLDEVPVTFRMDTVVETTSLPLPPYKRLVRDMDYLKRQDRFPRAGGGGWQNRKRRK